MKFNLVLFLILVICALGVVTSQHKARKLFVELQKEKGEARRLDVEWGQLQLEQSTWATPSRIERIASSDLHMKVPGPDKVRTVYLEHAGK